MSMSAQNLKSTYRKGELSSALKKYSPSENVLKLNKGAIISKLKNRTLSGLTNNVKRKNQAGHMVKNRELRVITNKFYKMVLKRNISELTNTEKLELEKKIYRVFHIIHSATVKTYTQQIKNMYREVAKHSKRGTAFTVKKLLVLGLNTMLLPIGSLLSGGSNLVYHGKVMAPSTYLKMAGGTVFGIAQVKYAIEGTKYIKAYTEAPITMNTTETREYWNAVNTDVPVGEVIDFLSTSSKYGKAIASDVAKELKAYTPSGIEIGLSITGEIASSLTTTTKNKTLKAIGNAATGAASSAVGAMYNSTKRKLFGKTNSPLKITGSK